MALFKSVFGRCGRWRHGGNILYRNLAQAFAHLQENKRGWAVLPKRWVVERTFSWLGHFLRLAKDVEMLTATSENRIRIAMLKITLAKRV
jgi:transposase